MGKKNTPTKKPILQYGTTKHTARPHGPSTHYVCSRTAASLSGTAEGLYWPNPDARVASAVTVEVLLELSPGGDERGGERQNTARNSADRRHSCNPSQTTCISKSDEVNRTTSSANSNEEVLSPPNWTQSSPWLHLELMWITNRAGEEGPWPVGQCSVWVPPRTQETQLSLHIIQGRDCL